MDFECEDREFCIYDAVKFNKEFDGNDYLVTGCVVNIDGDMVTVRHEDMFTGRDVNTYVALRELKHCTIFEVGKPIRVN